MSAAAQAAPRKVTQGWCRVPNSLIENSRGLTAAEFQLALIVIRKNGELPITDQNWSDWTGLSERTLEYAVAGLTKKGLLEHVSGKKAKYFTFQTANWEKYAATIAPATDRPKTEGRKPVKPVQAKPGAMVHPQCAHECALLKQDREETRGGLSLVPAPVAQPVAQKNTQGVEITTSGNSTNGGSFVSESGKSLKQQRRESPTLATPFAQPVAHIDHYAAAWSVSLATLQGIYPDVGTPFLVQLIGAVRSSGFTDVNDEELASAVRRAWQRKKNLQKSEGLFLVTVPEAVRVLRGTAKLDVAADQTAEQHRQRDALVLMVGKVAEVCADKGFDKPASKLEELKGKAATMFDTVEGAEVIENEMAQIEREIIKLARAHMTTAEKQEAAALVDRLMKPYGDKMAADQLEELRNSYMDRAALNALGIPRLSLFYV